MHLTSSASDHFHTDLLFPEQHLKDLVAVEVLQFLYVYVQKDMKPPVRHDAAVGDGAIARIARMHCHPYFRMIEDKNNREVMQMKLYLKALMDRLLARPAVRSTP